MGVSYEVTEYCKRCDRWIENCDCTCNECGDWLHDCSCQNEVQEAKGDEKPFNLNDHILTDKELGTDFETQIKIMEGENER